jgi:hypothetical protein
MDPAPPLQGKSRFWSVALAAFAMLAIAGIFFGWRALPDSTPAVADLPPQPMAEHDDVDSEHVHQFCGACHMYPPPHTFPKKLWKDEVSRGFEFFRRSGLALTPPSVKGVVKYYEERAPLELPPADIRYAATPCPVRFEQLSWPGPLPGATYAISNVNLVHLFDEQRLDILICDAKSGAVMVLQPYDLAPRWRVLAMLANPAHAEVVDLDGDGIKDLVVADLGSTIPTDDRCGRVIWLRGQADGSFTPHTLLAAVGRVADVQAAPFRTGGKLDLVVAEFGWNRLGSILLLENQTMDWSKPRFVPRVLDARHGAIHVPPIDLNKDGKPDFITVISQEHETVVAFLNEGDGRFRKETIYRAPHPAYGSSGIQLVDMNGDGHIDVLYTNGDALDPPAILKPDHGIQWLENPGNGTFPWKQHRIAPMYGAFRAVAADMDGDGDMDVVAVSFLLEQDFPYRKQKKLDAIVLFEQTTPGTFVRHALKTGDCDHVSCAVGNVMGRGLPDLVVGNFGSRDLSPATVWQHQGMGKKISPPPGQ